MKVYLVLRSWLRHNTAVSFRCQAKGNEAFYSHHRRGRAYAFITVRLITSSKPRLPSFLMVRYIIAKISLSGIRLKSSWPRPGALVSVSITRCFVLSFPIDRSCIGIIECAKAQLSAAALRPFKGIGVYHYIISIGTTAFNATKLHFYVGI